MKLIKWTNKLKIIISILKIIMRLFSLIFVGLALLAFGFYITIIAATDNRATDPLGQTWYNFDPFIEIFNTASLPLVGAIIERKIHPFLWDPIFLFFLSLPSWLGLISLSATFMIIAYLFFLPTKSKKVKFS
ncbi:MAG: hypothetical protein L3J15_08455 [Devosiaceae bacterium]|nr:hypothetical protein [Devosiaceae bacterium]